MNLREYLRAEWSQYIRPLIIKDKCEFCGSDEELHLHHIDKFYNILMETLEELQLQELDTEGYTKEELNLISHLMLSKQIRSSYKTLCKDCHTKLHYSEKYQEEYREYYYNPNGNYATINVEKLNKLNLNDNILTRFLLLCCFVKYNNNTLSIKDTNNRYRALKEQEIRDMLNIKKTEYYNTKRELINNNLIEINEQNEFLLNKSIVKRGNNNFKNNIKIFTNNYIFEYSKLSPVKHRVIGNLINNCLCGKELLYKGNFTKLKNGIKDCNIFKFNKKEVVLNPSIIYTGQLTPEYKKVIEEYENIHIHKM